MKEIIKNFIVIILIIICILVYKQIEKDDDKIAMQPSIAIY